MREGRAARGLKKKFFATMPVALAEIHTDAEFDNETVDYARSMRTRRRAAAPASVWPSIDSGIEPGTDFDNRITAFYDFTWAIFAR